MVILTGVSEKLGLENNTYRIEGIKKNNEVKISTSLFFFYILLCSTKKAGEHPVRLSPAS